MTQNTRLAPNVFELLFDVANGVSISEGDIICLNSGGYAEPAVDSAALVCGIGDALHAADNSAATASDGDITIKVGTGRAILVTVSGAVTNNDIGKVMRATSDATKLTVSGAVAGINQVPCGRLLCMDPDGSGKAFVDFRLITQEDA